MRTREFNKLTVGQRVIVDGEMDAKTFHNEPGIIVKGVECYHDVTVKFDRDISGWGDEDRLWGFEVSEVRKFDIVPEPVKAEAPKVEPKPKKRPHGAQEYKGNGKHSWEKVTSGDLTITERLRVPGGWVYRDRSLTGYAKTSTFVPVPQAVGYAV